MSFPNLVIIGDEGRQTINSISLDYAGVAHPESYPTNLIRANYTINRQTVIKNVGQATPQRSIDVAYTYLRFIHHWTGYADVLTESVTAGTSEQAAININLMRTAVLLDTLDFGSEEEQSLITFQSKEFEAGQRGPLNPSQGEGYITGEEHGTSWAYDFLLVGDDTILAATNKWLIKNVQISDNMNNSSKVTFTFEIKTPYLRISEIVNAIT